MWRWPNYLDLHLEVRLEVGEQSEENGKWEFKDLRHRGHAVLGQGHTQVLLDGVDEHLIGLEDGPGVLQDGQQQLEGQDLRSQLVGSEEVEAERDQRRFDTIENKVLVMMWSSIGFYYKVGTNIFKEGDDSKRTNTALCIFVRKCTNCRFMPVSLALCFAVFPNNPLKMRLAAA